MALTLAFYTLPLVASDDSMLAYEVVAPVAAAAVGVVVCHQHHHNLFATLACRLADIERTGIHKQQHSYVCVFLLAFKQELIK